MFRNRKKAVNLCISRFDAETKEAFNTFYEQFDASLASTPDAVDIEDTHLADTSASLIDSTADSISTTTSRRTRVTIDKS